MFNMKKLNFLFLLSTVIFFTSCKKEELRPDNNIIVDHKIYEFTNVDWVLQEAKFYLDNLDNGDKKVYDHFSPTQFQTVLNPLNGASISFDTIIKGVTTWRFTATNFILNNVKFYNTVNSNNTITVVGMENGSSRPLVITHLDESSVTFKVYEGYGSSNGVNYKYFSTLTFVKSNIICNGCEPNVYHGYTYGGVITSNTSVSSIIGTKWVVTKFYDGFSNNFPNDTLHFFSGTHYKINNGTPKNYTLSNILGNNMSDFTLYGFFTIGGDYSGMVPKTFVSDGQINSISFTDIFNTNNNKLVWMVRIQ